MLILRVLLYKVFFYYTVQQLILIYLVKILDCRITHLLEFYLNFIWKLRIAILFTILELLK